MKIPSVPPSESDLLQAEDRVSFRYLEHSVIHRDSNAIPTTDDRGVMHRTRLEIIPNALPGESVTETIQNEPISFGPARRQYAWRSAVREHTGVDDPDGTAEAHYPMALLGG